MKLNTNEWKEFDITALFDVTQGQYYESADYKEGKTPYVSASATNNGVGQMIDLPPDFAGNRIVTGKVECKAFYQGLPFSATSDANVFAPKFPMTPNVGLFLTSIITFNEKGKWSYGRQCRVGDSKGIILRLPIQHGSDGTPAVDPEKKYSPKGYIPDWQFMEDYIKSLHYKPLTTSRVHVPKKELNVSEWKDFAAGDIFNIQYGINMELNACEPCNMNDKDAVAFVARTSENNGVSAFVKKESGMVPQAAGTITCAGGGSVLSTFVQVHEFYSGRDLYLLHAKEKLSVKTKLFLTTVLLKNQYRYSYGRQANKTLPSLLLKLPIQHHADGTPVIDPEKKYSKKGYIPDWQFMEDYINTLPYSDKI